MATDPQELRARLDRHGVRATPRRLDVLRELASEPDDATAQELWSRLRQGGSTAGLATVYRTLALFCDAGLVDVLSHHHDEQCYRLCSETHHHHLVCERCHRVVEVEKCDLGGWVDKAAKRHGFVATEHRIEISGICADCRHR
ncbi:MAG TPA: Fur family transcriptional regulator [Gaiellaceae bacterium]|nr:Fur family transcriptional regulator [Gaiellaceae bacterium]